MLETSARLLRLLSLLQTPRDWSGAELAGRLDVDVRTVRRDIGRLRALGYPVEAAAGVPGYRLGAGANLPPLLLDDDEAVAVAIGLRTAANGTVDGMAETSLRALAKLEQVLPSRLRRRVGMLRTVTVALPSGGTPVDVDVLTAVAAACRDHQRLRFDYAAHDGAATVRTVEPHRLAHSGRRWYLVAWDVDRADWRTFRVDRLTPRVPTGPAFIPRELPDGDVAAYVSRGISARAYRHQARITLHVPIAVAADAIPPTIGVLTALDDTSCTLVAGSNSLDEMAVYLGLFGFPFQVHEPVELIERIAAVGAALTAAAQLGPGPS